MRLSTHYHLTYSLNVFPFKTLDDVWQVLEQKIPLIQSTLTHKRDIPFGLGLWLNNQIVSNSTTSDLIKFQQNLNGHNWYVFTMNAFPFGGFHNAPVKEKVYLPDWRSEKRELYTKKIATTLALLLPDTVSGSISTLPGGYKTNISDDDLSLIAKRILNTATHLKHIFETTGKKIVLGFEMEPDCLWESPQEFIDFYNKYLRSHEELTPFLGVCYDTCHQELLPTSPGAGILALQAHNIQIAKIQLSCALNAPTPISKQFIKESLQDPIYLHQTREKISSTEFKSYKDIPEALSYGNVNKEWITHFHIPIYSQNIGNELTVANDEFHAIIELLNNGKIDYQHLEIETYTFGILPAELKKATIEESIAAEYTTVLSLFNH